MDGNPKFVIGLTGNIATGKSLIRRMLENMGVFSIDTDSLGHRLFEAGSGVYQQVIHHFGIGILDATGAVDRARLAGIVFSDPRDLARLEAIIHPPVFHATDALIRHAQQPVVVLESIILLESELLERCNSIWVVISSRNAQLRRLIEQRGMGTQQANLRIDAQASQMEKVSRAGVVITNEGDIASTREQVQRAYHSTGQPIGVFYPGSWRSDNFTLSPTDNTHEGGYTGSPNTSPSSPFEERSGRHWLSARNGENQVAWIGLRFENLLCLVDRVQWMEDHLLVELMSGLTVALEDICRRWQCEAALVAVPDGLAEPAHFLVSFTEIPPELIPVSTWREHAIKLKKEGMRLFYRQYHQRLLLIDSPSTRI